MAGLQYNFFPTDFFYPRPQPVALDATHGQASLPLQIHKRNVVNDLEEQPKGNNIRDNKLIKAPLHMQGRINDQDHGKHLKLSPNPLSWLSWIPKEHKENS
ncbi:hypothetical protein FCV25MIE_14330 [Fagus crenata]